MPIATPEQDRPEQKWPEALWLMRHGQSAGNVARDAAEAAGHPIIELAHRDMDVPLSDLGERQADAVGAWFADLPPPQRPQVVLCSPYVRAVQTARRIVAALPGGDVAPVLVSDERLREKEFGILDRLTVHGIRERYPELAEQRAHVGKFYFRPPGGESWCDVILRLRSVIELITREHRRERVLVVAHQVTVNCFRYLLDRLTEAEILEIDRQADVPNCGITRYDFDPTVGRHGKLVPRLINFIAPVRDAGEPVTAEPDAPVAAKP